MKANVTYWLDETAARFPDKTAYADEKKEITFAQLRVQARAIACELTARGLFKKPVAVFLEKGVDVLVSFMGAAYSCNFYSPIDVDMPGSRVNKILEVLEPAVVITTEALREVFSAYDYKGEFLLLEDVLAADGQEAEQQDTGMGKVSSSPEGKDARKGCSFAGTGETESAREAALEAARKRGIDTDLLYVLFTSGSTGVPKGVTINHRAVIDYIDWVTETLSLIHI